jgi:hypothetical protein
LQGVTITSEWMVGFRVGDVLLTLAMSDFMKRDDIRRDVEDAYGGAVCWVMGSDGQHSDPHHHPSMHQE